ncbi:ribonuclease P protein component [Angustibacter aerolatus]
MLPAAHRMRRSEDFRLAVRRGRRSGTRSVVGHLVLPEPGSSLEPAQVGLVVSKAVGGAVVRNLVKRRLRHLAADRLASVPAGSRLVLRALPASATVSSAVLAADLDRVLLRLVPVGSPT